MDHVAGYTLAAPSLVSADFPEKLLFCKHSVWVFGKKSKKIIFFCGKSCFFSIYPYTTCCLIYLNSSNLNNIIFSHV